MKGRLRFVVACIWHSLATGQEFSVSSEAASERVSLGYGTCISACYDAEFASDPKESAWLTYLIQVQGGMRIDGSHIKDSWDFLDMVLAEKPNRPPFEYLQAMLPLLYSTPDMWNVTWMEDRIMRMWQKGCFAAGVNLARMFELVDSPGPPLRAAFVSLLTLALGQEPSDVVDALGAELKARPLDSAPFVFLLFLFP
jgi:hypothetical protein